MRKNEKVFHISSTGFAPVFHGFSDFAKCKKALWHKENLSFPYFPQVLLLLRLQYLSIKLLGFSLRERKETRNVRNVRALSRRQLNKLNQSFCSFYNNERNFLSF